MVNKLKDTAVIDQQGFNTGYKLPAYKCPIFIPYCLGTEAVNVNGGGSSVRHVGHKC
jgi:hypothetical protein